MEMHSQVGEVPRPAVIRRDDGRPGPGGRRRWLGLFVVCLGVMMAFVNVSSTISSLGAIQDDLRASAGTLVWITSAYSLAVVSLVMSAGTLGDLVGRRLVFVSGAVLFSAGSLAAFLADGSGTLIAAQAVMGVGGAAVLPTSLTIVSVAFTDPHERTTAISVWAACSGLGLAVGPLVAGALLERFSWHPVYLINLVIGATAALLSPLFVHESKHPSRRLDPAGVLLGTVTIASATYAIIQGGATGYTSAPIIAAYAVFALSLALFVRVELRHHDPMLDLRLFRSLSFTAVMGVAATTMFGFVGISLLTVLYLERVHQVSALGTGVRLLAMFATYVAVSAVASRLVRRVGFTVMLTGGLVLMGAGALALLAVGPFDGFDAIWPGLLLAGVGSGLLVAPSSSAAVSSVPPLQAGMAASAVNMARQLGGVLGPSVLGTIVTSRFPRDLRERLVDAGLPGPGADQVVTGAAHGGGTTGLPASLARTVNIAVAQAFTDAVHLGLLIGGIVLLAMAVPAALYVRHRLPGGGGPAV
ncbi:MFS transporter [Sphaerisporangium corydalis]|uniref:MFS transporter n=1 Tax=Sphaerisporangium corydalis TaxID=1441875 RepID=A0ABV9EP08_9ACTN|nr:MFS transporter [Sphaerisporangium corydalis]